MTKLVLFLLLSLRALCATDAQIIQALEMTEASYGQIGRAGEITPAQLSPATVHDHGADPLANLRWLRREFVKRHVALLPFNYALAWNAGLTAATTGKAPTSSYRYACRMVANLEQISGQPEGSVAVSRSMTVRQPILFLIPTH